MEDTEIYKWLCEQRKDLCLENRTDDFVKSLVIPSLIKMYIEKGIEDYHTTGEINFKLQDEQWLKFNASIMRSEDVIMVTCLENPALEDVDEHISKIKMYRQEGANRDKRRVLGAICGKVMTKKVSKYGMKQGLYVLVPCGEIVIILNTKEFKPKCW